MTGAPLDPDCLHFWRIWSCGCKRCETCGGDVAGVRVYPQDQWPQMVWHLDPRHLNTWYLWYWDNPGDMTVYYAAPVAITNDGKGGWLPWLAEALGERWGRLASEHGEPSEWWMGPYSALTPQALAEAMLRRAGLLIEEVVT